LYSHNLGNIGSPVKVDGIPVANLDLKLSMINGAVANVTELYTKGFNLTIPPNTHEAGYKAGTWRGEVKDSGFF
jgi:hypothetical protein